MDFKQLEAFMQISKLQSFSKASEALFLTQPALSNQINSLEKEIGTQLFIRSTKKVFPTKAGSDFYTYAQKILALRDQSLYEMGKYLRYSAGEINIVASSVPSQYILPKLISDFKEEYQNIIFRLHQKDSNEVFEELVKYQYDIGFVGTNTASNRYNTSFLCKDKLVLIFPANMTYSGSQNPEDISAFISSKNFIMREQGSGTRTELETFLNSINITRKDLKVVGYFNSTQGIIESVSNGMGISFVSKLAVEYYSRLNLVNVMEIESSLLMREIYYILKKDMLLTPIQEVFINYVKNYFNND